MIKTAIQQKRIGDLLKEKRKERNLTIEQIAEITKIRAEYLRALEESDYKSFPSEVYLKGFLKNYAKYLGINSDQTLALYRRDNIITTKKEKKELFGKLKDRLSKIVITPNRLIILLVIVLIIGVAMYLSTYIGKVLKKPVITMSSPIDITAEGEYTYTTNKENVELIGTIDVNSKVLINGEEVGPATTTSFNKSFILSDISNKIIIKAISPFGRESQITITVNKDNGEVVINPSDTVSEINAKITILLDNTSLTVMTDGSIKIDKTYMKGKILEFTASEGITVTTNKSSAISININGIEEKVDGKTVTFELIDGKILKN
jgi:cytoskeletal protein RodZ